MNKTKKLYTVEWSQPYRMMHTKTTQPMSQDFVEWEEWLERIIELKLEYSDMADAKQIIGRIMEM